MVRISIDPSLTNGLRHLSQIVTVHQGCSYPISFIGYSFKGIKRITFYAVIDKDFAVCEVFEFDKYNQCWTHELRAP